MLKNPVNEAIILAAGQGMRLGTRPGLPKCLQSVGGRPLLEHQIQTLRHFGVSRVLVIIGSEATCVKEWLSSFPGVECIVNERFAKTNSLYSLSLAKDWVRSDFLLLNCDVLAHPAIYRAALSQDGPVLIYDSGSELGDEEMKVRIQDGHLRQVSKEMAAEEASGENVGMIRISQEMLGPLFGEVQRIVDAGNERAWAPMALNGLVKTIDLPCFDIAGKPWIEIDFYEDLCQAREEVWPLMQSAMSEIHASEQIQEHHVYRLAA